MRTESESPRYFFFFVILALFSIGAKVFLASLGHNYDLESYEIVQNIFRSGRSVYAGTIRYNYGPIWFLILSGIGYLADRFPLIGGPENFHLWVALFLSLVDVSAASCLRWFGYRAAALVFLLSPISLLITGFHSQFDQLPILFALPAVYFLGRAGSVRVARILAVSLLMGLSLITKHSLLFFPLWLVFWLYEREPRKYLSLFLLALVPASLFLISFLPWMFDPASRAGISANVFHYASDNLYAFLPKLLGLFRINSLLEVLFGWVPIFSGYKFLWLCAMVVIGWVFRRRNPFDLLFLYTITLLVFTPALSDQYLAIPAIACAVYWRSPWIKGFVFLSAVFLAFFSPANLVTIPVMTGVREALAGVPIRRYFAVLFLAVFLALEIRRARANILSPGRT